MQWQEQGREKEAVGEGEGEQEEKTTRKERQRQEDGERERESATFVLRDLPRYFSIKLLGTPAAPHRHQNFAIGETARRDDAETGFRA